MLGTDWKGMARCLAAVAAALALLGGFASIALAEVRGRDHGSHARLEFDLGELAEYRLLRRDSRIIADFDRPVGEGFAASVRSLGDYLQEARVIGDGSQVLLVLAPSISLEDARVGGTVVFELRRLDSEAEAAATAVPAPELPAPELDLSADTQAAERPTIRVRGGEHPDFSRIVFDWTAPVAYRVDRTGGTVLISFDARADADFTRAAPVNLSRIDAIRQIEGTGNLTVTVAVPPDIRLRYFRTGTKVVVDVLDGDGSSGPDLAEASAPERSTEPVPPAPRPEPLPMAAAREPAARSLHAADDPAVDEAEAPAAAADAGAAAEPELEPERLAGAPLPLLRSPPSQHQPGVPRPPAEVRPSLAARFDPGVPSTLAVFRRGRSLWLVLASESRLDANALAAQGGASLGGIDVVQAEGGVALRVELRVEGDVAASRQGTAWTVALREPTARPAAALALKPQPDYPLGPRLLIEGGSAQALVRLTDPLVGDELIVAPIREAGLGMPDGARFAQFRLLPTVQGVVVRPMSPSMATRIARDGVEIADHQGLLLSSSADTAHEVTVIAPPVEVEQRLLEIEAWRGAESGFIERRQALQKHLAEAPEAERDRARLDLARFYFAHGYAQEALGLLNLVEESQPSIVDRETFAVLRGAARVLADEIGPAVSDLGRPGLADSRDAALWRAVAAAKSADWPRAASEFGKAGRLIETYPPPFAGMLARWAAQTAIEMNDTAAAEAHLSRLSVVTDGDSDAWASTSYLRGVIASRAGRWDDAAAAFEVAAASDDRLHRTLSELALVEIDLEEGAIDWEEAVASMESLRFAWRGDQLEFDLIDRIEMLYWQAGRYREALATLQQAGRSFPDTPAGEAFEARLQARFVELFGSDRIAAMSPLAAVSLYNDYATLMPDGEDGDRVLLGLAERLAEIDLLDQAGDVLAGLMENRLQGAVRARAGTRLAGLRLLSGQPGAAIEALDASRADVGGDSGLRDQRRLLRAHALAELERFQEALALLEGDRTPLAAAARADIAWRGQDWPTAAAALSELIEPPPAAGASIAGDQAELVLNLGIALALANDARGLDRLAERYGAAMARSPSANTFAILTRSPGETPPIADLAAIRSQVSEVDLFRDFLRGYRSTGRPEG